MAGNVSVVYHCQSVKVLLCFSSSFDISFPSRKGNLYPCFNYARLRRNYEFLAASRFCLLNVVRRASCLEKCVKRNVQGGQERGQGDSIAQSKMKVKNEEAMFFFKF